MQARDEELSLDTQGNGEVIDLTGQAQKAIANSGRRDGRSVTVPVVEGDLLLGVWQKIVCVDFDDRPRTRKVVVQLVGE